MISSFSFLISPCSVVVVDVVVDDKDGKEVEEDVEVEVVVVSLILL